MTDQDEMIEKLLEETRFSRDELVDYLKYAEGPTIPKDNYAKMLAGVGIKSEKLQDRMWKAMDTDDSGVVDILELIRTINTLNRGTLEDVTKYFFSIYDLDGDKELSKTEIVEVYRELLTMTQTTMTSKQVERISEFIHGADTDHDGTLDYEEFAAAVKQGMEEAEKRADEEHGGWKYWGKIALLVFLTAWFEMGTSFALPAMGALSKDMKDRVAITDADIGMLTGLYYAAAVIGPLVGGWFTMKIGPAPVLAVANILVIVGSILQAIPGKGMFWLLVIARLIIGLGGEVTPFTTIEILNIVFPPKAFMLMCGVRNLVQSGSGFLAFFLLPILAKYSVDFALWFIVIMGGVSLVTCVIVGIYVEKLKKSKSAEHKPSSMIRALATRMVPSAPGKWADFKMPLAFFAAIPAIKAYYFAPFAFTAFSIKYFSGAGTQFQAPVSAEDASFLSGFMSLLAGILGPLMGPLSDVIGNRALSLAGFLIPSFVGFMLFAYTGITPYVGIVLLAISYGFGDTVAYVSIRLIVGEKRAGIGYGIYGAFGNIFSFLVPYIGGVVFENAKGVWMCFYFAMLMLFGTVLWLVVRFKMGGRSLIELPASKLVMTEDNDIDAATLIGIIGTGDATVAPDRDEDATVEDPAGLPV